jgi:4-azaleucine resistance transporter AzlC
MDDFLAPAVESSPTNKPWPGRGGGKTGALQRRLKDFWQGVVVSIPIVVGYLPIGIAYGILARQAGFSLFQAVSLSLFVYAGAAQFIAVSMIAAGANPFSIIATIGLVNLRHVLYSASVAPFLQKIGISRLLVLAFGLTDEAFSIESVVLAQGAKTPSYIFGLQLAPYLAWNAGSLLGGLLGGWLSGIQALGLDFALPAMFIALLIPLIKNRELVITAIVSGFLSLIFGLFLKGSWNIILATLVAATLGMGLSKWKTSSGS